MTQTGDVVASSDGLVLPDADAVVRLVAKRSYCTLATMSERGFPHSAGVVYAFHEGVLWTGTLRSSRKARNMAVQPRVHVNVPVRRVPVGPPCTIAFAGTARLLDPQDDEVQRLVRQGALKAVTSHGELDLDGICMVRITPRGAWHTYGIGMSLWSFVRDPLNAAGRVDFPPS
ncbi:pyridoxamine 5'-phosphate oxidase family protein [Thalassiella azotivora]